MSYRRSFTKQIAVKYSGVVSQTVSVSVDGKSVSKYVSIPYQGTAYEDVTVNVDVDTVPFDNSVHQCNTQVGVLTGAVVATEQAQVASIRDKAMKVGNTIINGFFDTVRSDISQQIMELKNQIDSLLLHLHELAKRCVDKQHQMESDYQRISSRYLKIFEELNHELEHRIYEIDRPVFQFKQSSDKHSYRALNDDMVGVATVSNAENSQLQARISASVVKKKAMDTLMGTNEFLRKQKETEYLLQHSIFNDSKAAVYHAPVCYVETYNKGGVVDEHVHSSAFLGNVEAETFRHDFKRKPWKSMSTAELDNIKIYFNKELNAHYATSSSHDERVRACITHMFNHNIIQS